MRIVAPKTWGKAPVGALALDEVPGASIAYHGAFRHGGAELTVVCATRPVPLWLDSLQPAALAGMSGLVHRHLRLDALQPKHVTRAGSAAVQEFSGSRGESVATGRHHLGFDADGDLVACTAVCVEPGGADEGDCAAGLGEIVVAPGFVLREPSVVETGLSGALAHPREVALGGVVIVAVLMAWHLCRRPDESALGST